LAHDAEHQIVTFILHFTDFGVTEFTDYARTMSDIKPAAPCCQASFCHLWKVFQLLNVTTPATDRWQSEAISFLQQSLYNKQHTPTIQFIIMTF